MCNECDGVEDNEPDLEEDMPRLSLDAFRGRQEDETFQVRASLAGEEAWAILDTGSTHNFVREGMAARLSLPILERLRACVSLPNYGMTASNDMCKDLQLEVQGNEFLVDMYVIPLTGFDMVLRIRWLNTLRRIMWDFEAREMEFKLNGTTLIWYAEIPTDSTHLNVLDTKRSPDTDLASLMKEFEDVRHT